MQDTKRCRCTTYEACKGFILNETELCNISSRILQSMLKGLSKAGHETATVRCYQTFVQDLPTGEETGYFMGLDLGGTNFRVLSVILEGKGKPIRMIKETYELPPEKKTGPGEELFDHVALCLADFLSKHTEHKSKNVDKIPLGFTFSFPLTQDGLYSGYLIKWTKAFEASGVIGKDVVQLLKDAIRRKNIKEKLDPIAICNDTTGTLMSSAVNHENVRIGLIIGTGNNACYVERIENIENFKGDPSKPYMIINCESGNFGADGALDDYLTEYDKTLIENSSHKYNQTFEKCVSGRYLGEQVRLIMVRLINDKVLFNNSSTIGHLEKQYGFKTEYITDIENDPEGGPFKKTQQVLEEMGIQNYDDQDLADIRFIAEAVSTRSACFVSALIATLINKMDFNPVTVAVDGSLYRYHPRYKMILEQVTRCLVKPEIEFKYILSEDGSGRGAALIAAVTTKN